MHTRVEIFPIYNKAVIDKLDLLLINVIFRATYKKEYDSLKSPRKWDFCRA